VPKNVLTFTHVDGYKFGGNFLNIDLLYSSNADPVHGANEIKDTGAAEVYIVYRHTLSLNKISGTETFKVGGVLRDLGIELGSDLNTKHNAFAARKISPVAGLVFSFEVPGFLNLGFLGYKEWNTNSFAAKHVVFDPTLMIAASWGINVVKGLSIEGFGNVILPKGKDGGGNDTVTEILFHPKVMFDLGTLWDSKGYQVGAGWEYWYNKFGNDGDKLDGCRENAAFVEVAIHL
jgi:hypothetical protein